MQPEDGTDKRRENIDDEAEVSGFSETGEDDADTHPTDSLVGFTTNRASAQGVLQRTDTRRGARMSRKLAGQGVTTNQSDETAIYTYESCTRSGGA